MVVLAAELHQTEEQGQAAQVIRLAHHQVRAIMVAQAFGLVLVDLVAVAVEQTHPEIMQ
jgi:hypothetical protein